MYQWWSLKLFGILTIEKKLCLVKFFIFASLFKKVVDQRATFTGNWQDVFNHVLLRVGSVMPFVAPAGQR